MTAHAKDEFGRSTDIFVGGIVWAAIFGALWWFAGMSPPEAVFRWLTHGVHTLTTGTGLYATDDAVMTGLDRLTFGSVWFLAISITPFMLAGALMSDGRRVGNNPKGHAVVFAIFAAIGVGLALYASSRGTL